MLELWGTLPCAGRHGERLFAQQPPAEVQLTYEPVFIRVPDSFKEQMLTNVPFFHEVGHFVDRDNSISDIVYDMIEPELKKSKTSRFLREHFPRFVNVELEGNSDAE